MPQLNLTKPPLHVGCLQADLWTPAGLHQSMGIRRFSVMCKLMQELTQVAIHEADQAIDGSGVGFGTEPMFATIGLLQLQRNHGCSVTGVMLFIIPDACMQSLC